MIKYKGFDFAEILEALGIENDADGVTYNHSLLEYKCQRFMWEKLCEHLAPPHYSNFDTDGLKMIKEMRAFLSALVSESGNEWPLWHGLSEVDDNWTFAKYFVMLLPNMWT